MNSLFKVNQVFLIHPATLLYKVFDEKKNVFYVLYNLEGEGIRLRRRQGEYQEAVGYNAI